MLKKLAIATLTASLFIPLTSHAKTLRWASQGDLLTLDPHAQNERVTNNFSNYVYEPLVEYDKEFTIVPALARSWEQLSDTLWRFHLRKNVSFHDGSPFTADDVVFSFQRAMSPTSGFKAYVDGFVNIKKIDDYTVEIETAAPNPVLLRLLTNVFMMSKSWAEANNATTPQDFGKKEENFATHHTNGTGSYQLESREADVRTIYTENKNWWGQAEKTGNVSRVVYTPIAQNATRTAALLSGEIDFILDPPAQDLARLKQQAKVIEGNEFRTIYIGLDQHSPELKYSSIKGKNPFTDQRVREALYISIDTQAIQKIVMRGASLPTGTMIAPQVNGWTEALAARPAPDLKKAQHLLAEAGYGPNELRFTLDCSNDTYINDEAICQAIINMWAKAGVKATLNTMPRAIYFPKLHAYDTSAYLFGWGVPTFDALYTLQSLIHSKGEGADGAFNFGHYSNTQVDQLIDQIKVETDPQKRNAAIHEALTIHAKEVGHIPLHDQVIPWAMAKNVHVVHRANNHLTPKWVTID